MSGEILLESLNEIDRRELVIIELLGKETMISQVNATVQMIRAMAPMQVMSTLRLVQVMYRANALMSSLGTSAVLWVLSMNPFILSTFFYDDRQTRQDRYRSSCIDKNSITPTGFSNERSTHLPSVFTVYWPTDAFGLYNSSMSDMVSGFLAGCFPLDAALAGSLDCLFHQECLGMLSRYFPDANRVGILL